MKTAIFLEVSGDSERPYDLLGGMFPYLICRVDVILFISQVPHLKKPTWTGPCLTSGQLRNLPLCLMWSLAYIETSSSNGEGWHRRQS